MGLGLSFVKAHVLLKIALRDRTNNTYSLEAVGQIRP